ncbi:MAG: helix-turn-helix domain-containing protein [Patescibacteria group bacterium]|nr:helix-turn-helix domain-containing protein [Patescibacteria group bacterium]
MPIAFYKEEGERTVDFQNYENDIQAKAKTLFVQGMECEDVAQELRLALWRASYDQTRGAAPRSYAISVLNWAIGDLRRHTARENRFIPDRHISLSEDASRYIGRGRNSSIKRKFADVLPDPRWYRSFAPYIDWRLPFWGGRAAETPVVRLAERLLVKNKHLPARVRQRFAEQRKEGTSVREAARKAGISSSSFYRWLHCAEQQIAMEKRRLM